MKFFGAPADRPARGAVDAGPTQDDVRSAYEHGRRDARHRRRSHPLMMLTLVVLAVAGAAVLGLAAWTGSFSRGGQVADRQLAVAADQAAPVVRDAARSATDRVRGADEVPPAADQAG